MMLGLISNQLKLKSIQISYLCMLLVKVCLLRMTLTLILQLLFQGIKIIHIRNFLDLLQTTMFNISFII